MEMKNVCPLGIGASYLALLVTVLVSLALHRKSEGG
jgi:hypothetical protein